MPLNTNEQYYGNLGLGNISLANPNLDGTGNMVAVFAAPANKAGTTIISITIKAIESTTAGMVRLFLSTDGGTSKFLWREIRIPAIIANEISPAFSTLMLLNYIIQPDTTLYASTENAEGFNVIVEGRDWAVCACE